jgi:two-component system, chemotaxis family, response regulator PixG
MFSNSTQPEPNIIETLLQISQSGTSGCLRIGTPDVSWSLHLVQGSIVYASDSIGPWDRLERLLRKLGLLVAHPHKSPAVLDSDVLVSDLEDNHPVKQAVGWMVRQRYLTSKQAVTLLSEWAGLNNPVSQDPSYQAIYWLFDWDLISPLQTASLIEESVKEILEVLLLLKNVKVEFSSHDQLANLPKFCKLSSSSLLETCLQRLRSWQSLGPHIWSPYQRPYFFGQAASQSRLSPELQQKLGSTLRGLSFRHLAAFLKKDELQLAQNLRPYVVQGFILLREPQAPFDKLPRIPTTPLIAISEPSAKQIPGVNQTGLQQSPMAHFTHQSYRIACIDDSPAILNVISRLLGDEKFSVIAINDPVKALMQIMRSKPDLILLDVGMPRMDGYELCRLLRNHSAFRSTPVIMVTGHTGIIDRARAKLVGASDYLTKPFTREGLLKVVFKHLGYVTSDSSY